MHKTLGIKRQPPKRTLKFFSVAVVFVKNYFVFRVIHTSFSCSYSQKTFAAASNCSTKKSSEKNVYLVEFFFNQMGHGTLVYVVNRFTYVDYTSFFWSKKVCCCQQLPLPRLAWFFVNSWYFFCIIHQNVVLLFWDIFLVFWTSRES